MSELRSIQQKINQVVEDWFKELVSQLTTSRDIKPRGLWDRIKTGLTNLWWQTNAKQNPHKWVNRFGDLGVAECFCPIASFSLSEYLHIKETIEEAENIVIEAIENPEIEKIRLFKILSTAKENLKSRLINVLAKEIDSRPTAPRSEEPRGEEPRGEEPRGEEPRGEEPRGEEPRGEEPRGEEPRGEEPRGEEPRGEEPRGEEQSLANRFRDETQEALRLLIRKRIDVLKTTNNEIEEILKKNGFKFPHKEFDDEVFLTQIRKLYEKTRKVQTDTSDADNRGEEVSNQRGEEVSNQEREGKEGEDKEGAIGTASVNDENASAEVVIGGRGKRNTNTTPPENTKTKPKVSQNIQKLVDEAVSAKKSGRIQPNKDWLDEDGYVLKDKYPMLVAWVSSQEQRNPRIDADLISAMRHSSSAEIKSKFKGIRDVIEGEENKSVVLNSIKRRLARYSGAFEKMLVDLEILPLKINPSAEKGSSVANTESTPSTNDTNNSEESEVTNTDPSAAGKTTEEKTLEEVVLKFAEECNSKKDLLIKLQQRIMIPIARELTGERQERFRKWFGETATQMNKDTEYSKEHVINWVLNTEGPEKTAQKVDGTIKWKAASFFAGIRAIVPQFDLKKFKELIENASPLK